MLETSKRKANRLFVGREGTALVGVSGHRLASLDVGCEVTRIGELGAYTIVQWEGHQGYVESNQLMEPEEFTEAVAGPETEAEEPVHEEPVKIRRSLFLRLIKRDAA